MFIRFVKRKLGSRVMEYAQIARKYRENGKQITKVIKHLGPVKSLEDRERYREMFSVEMQRSSMKDSAPEGIEVGDPLDFGMIYAARAIAQETGIFRSLAILGDYRETAFLMIASRLMQPGSDISLIRLFARLYYPWPAPRLGRDDLYRCLDRLHQAHDLLERSIFRALHPDVSVVHYDLTSSYFEGREENDLVLFGYSRDRKRGKEQIVIGIVMASGLPIHHEVWPGNTVDPATLENTISVLGERFHIGKVIIVADRAFGRSRSLDLLDMNEYITAAYRWDMPYRTVLMETDFSTGTMVGDLIVKTVHIDVGDIVKDDATDEQRALAARRRHIAVYSRSREETDIMELEEKLSLIRKKISDITDMGELKRSLGPLKSLVKFRGDEAMPDGRRIGILRKLAGRFLIITNTDLNEADAVSAYRDQWKIERSFRTIKSFIEIRPVYHRKAERIRAHVFVCVLSLLLSRLMESRVQGMSIGSMEYALSTMKAVPVKLPSGTMMYRSHSSEGIDVLRKMGIDPPDRILGGALPHKDS